MDITDSLAVGAVAADAFEALEEHERHERVRPEHAQAAVYLADRSQRLFEDRHCVTWNITPKLKRILQSIFIRFKPCTSRKLGSSILRNSIGIL